MAKKKKKDIEWSHYQLAIYDFIQNGQGNAVIEACAGSGKSTSLVKCLDFIGEDKRILITAFNKDIVNVLTKKTKNRTNVSSMTMHSLGLQMLRTNFRDKSLELDEFKYRSFVSTNLKKLTSIDTYALGKKDFLRYVDNICKYIDFGRYYLCQTVKDLDFIEDRYEIDTIADEKAVAIQSMEWGKRNLDTIDYTDMVWLPNMLNCQPYGLKFDWIAVDEAQDLNCAQRELLLKCRKISTRMLIFGDSDQCQPTGTKVMLTDGTERNIEDLNVGDYVVTYNSEYGCYVGYKNYSAKGNITNQQCKRISAIEHHTENELITIETTSGKKSSYTPSHICYARMNREYSKTAYCTYIMRNDKGMYRIGKTKLYRNNYTFSLNHRLLSEGCIDAWILNIFETEKEARICELVNSYKFGIPQLVFDMERANNAEGRTPYFLNEEICEIYKQINENIEERVKRCLEYNHRKLEYPIVSRNKKNYISKEHFTTFNACNLFPKFMEVNTLNENNLRKKHKYKISRTPEKITNVKYDYGEFEVYSLDVEENHNYVADGILTHNCLYSFSGSDPDSFNILKSLPNTISLPLSISYRCADNIVSYAKQLVPTIEENTEGRKGEIIENAKIEDVNDGDMIVCRNNAPLMKIYNSFIKEGKKCFVRGKDIGNNLKRIVKNTKKENLYKDLSKDGVFVRLYSNLFDARDTLMLNSNIDLDTAMQSSLIVNRLDTIKALEVLADGINTTDELIEKISNVFSDRKKNGISLSTIHKAKGLEADRVFVACKSLMPSKSAKKDWEIKQEYNLMYVAYTRAKNTLGFLDESYFDDIISDLPKEKKKLTAIEMQVNKVLGKKPKYISASTAYASEIVKRAGKLEMPKSNSKSLSKEAKRVQVKPSLSGLFNRKITKRTLL